MSSTLTLTGDWLISVGNRMQTHGTGNLGTYATGGVAVTASQVGLGRISFIQVQPAGGYVFEYDATAGKIKAYWTGAATSSVLAEVDTSTNLAAITFRFVAEGY